MGLVGKHIWQSLCPSTGTPKGNNFGNKTSYHFASLSRKHISIPLYIFLSMDCFQLLIKNMNYKIVIHKQIKSSLSFSFNSKRLSSSQSRLSVNSSQLVLGLWNVVFVLEYMEWKPSRGMCTISFQNQPTPSYPLPLQALQKHNFTMGIFIGNVLYYSGFS